MNRGCLSLLFACVALAQVRPQEDPIQVAMRAYHSARDQGQFDEAAAKRELARNLLDQIPVDSQFGNSVWNVAQLYAGSGLSAQALAIGQQALARYIDGNSRCVARDPAPAMTLSAHSRSARPARYIKDEIRWSCRHEDATLDDGFRGLDDVISCPTDLHAFPSIVDWHVVEIVRVAFVS